MTTTIKPAIVSDADPVPEFLSKDDSLRVTVADPTLLKQEGFRRVTTSLRNQAVALAAVGGARGGKRTAKAWATVLDAALNAGGEA